MSTTLIPLTHLSLTSYALYLSYQNITRLQQYERTSEKAAQWSNTAAEKLRKTRTTQAAGTIALIISFLTSLFLLFTSKTTTSLVLSSLVNTAALFASYAHMSSFWNEREQSRIPFVTQFNEAIRGSEQVVVLLATLGLGWGVAAGVWAVGMQSVVVLGVWGLVLGARLVVVAPRMGWRV